MQYLNGVKQCFINIRDPVKTFYIKTDKNLESGANYYIIMLVHEQIITLTNKFNKKDDNIYEINFFANKITLPFCDLMPLYQKVEFIGINYRSANDYDVDIFDEIFYEKDTEYISNKKTWEYLLHYYDSDLVNFHRKGFGDVIKSYGENVDNVLRIMDGMLGVGFTLNLPWGNHDPRFENHQYIVSGNTNIDGEYFGCGLISFEPIKKNNNQ